LGALIARDESGKSEPPNQLGDFSYCEYVFSPV
jgi:hypothetical protein